MSTEENILDGIAIIGMAGRFPGAANVREFWRNLVDGKESIATVEAAASEGDGVYVPRRGVLDKPEWFDAAFFGISPREAEIIDPQQRVFMEECWNALEDAACDPTRYTGAIGVFAGMSNNTYWAQNVVHHPEVITSVGWLTAMMANEKDYLATRVAYKLNLRGPALNIYTACSTSLVAVCQAVQGLLNYTCDVALAGGVSITFPHERGYRYDEGGILSPDGHCRAFDAQAAGTVFSNGIGVVTLKRLAEAVADGDHIYAVIKGAALNNDGSNKVSFTAPSVEGHAEVITLAHALAGFEPQTVGYIEAHGTGTPLGDPIEIAGLTQAFAGAEQKQYCAIGSVKTNIGHLDAAAGIAGLIKTALILQHRFIPASLHYTQANPALLLEHSPFFVNAAPNAWAAANGPRRAGVSSFGVGGTNAHVALEEAPRVDGDAVKSDDGERPQVLLLSAKTESALARRATELADHLEQIPEVLLSNVAFTLQKGRAPFPCRRTIVCHSRGEAIAALRGSEPRRSFAGHAKSPAGVVFMFPGQGAQYGKMGAQLYAAEPVFRAAFDECCAILGDQVDLRGLLFGNAWIESPEALRETRVTQPAIFATSYALARLWMSLGIIPAACIGHSVGEYVAAVLSGVFSLADGLKLVAARARLMQDQPPGSMLAARMSEAEAAALVNDQIALAAVNAPQLVVLAGADEAIAQLEAQLLAGNVACKRLETTRAFHSPMVDPIVAPLAELAAGVPRKAPGIPIFSTVTGTWLTDEEATNPGYWARHARETVRFSPAIAQMLQGEHELFLECGPGQTLSQLARQHRAPERHVVFTIREGVEEQISFRSAAGQLWARGVDIDWKAIQMDGARRVPLPTYPFERKRYFLEPPASAQPVEATVKPSSDTAVEPAIASVAEIEPAQAPDAPHHAGRSGVLEQLTQELRKLSGLDFEGVPAGTSFLELGFDSLFLTQLAVAVQKRFKVKVTFRQLLQELTCPAELAAYLDSKLPADFAAPAKIDASATSADVPVTRPAARPHGPFRGIDSTLSKELQPPQKEFLDGLISEYCRRTAGSKRHTAEHRRHLADPRAVAGFRREWKEIVYPLVCDRSEGARLWDIDGNEYIDITLGFGQILFGHRAPFVVEAVEKQLHRGFEIGPTSPLAGTLADRLSRFLRFDRVAFCNTGSEAVAAALRLARTVTGRDKVVVFSGAYHGIFDEVLFRPGPSPIAPGIPHSAVQNLVVLDYGTDESLAWIRDHAEDLAAVMVEPIQSRHPALAPRDFLQELRRITAQHDTALIFDEIVTGFRVAPRGAQEHFEIQADLATYGKVIGGGLPVGIVAGSSRFMDALDGGAWQYGDDSFPETGVTFFAGTFVRHPLALAAVSAVLAKLEESGPELQQDLASKARALVHSMNAHLEKRGVPLRWENFSSLYHLPLDPEHRYAPLVFAHMRANGIHAWENRPCFLSTAHASDDIERVKAAFCSAVDALVAAQLLPGTITPGEEPGAVRLPAESAPSLDELSVPAPASIPVAAEPVEPAQAQEPHRIHAPVSEGQREILLAAQLGTDANCAFNDAIALRIRGPLDREALNAALAQVVERHEALRTAFTPDLSEQVVYPALAVAIVVIDLSAFTPDDQEAALAQAAEVQAITEFDLHSAPLWRAELFSLGSGEHEFRFTAHHAICDGWSFSTIASEIAAHYSAIKDGTTASLEPALPLRRHIADQDRSREAGAFAESESWWVGQFADAPPLLNLPIDGARSGKRSFNAATTETQIAPEIVAAIRKTAASLKATPFAVLFSAFGALLGRLSGEQDVVIGIASAEQAQVKGALVGHCVTFLPIRLNVDTAHPFAAIASKTNDAILDAREHAGVTFGRLLQKLPFVHREPGRMPLTAISFNLDHSPADLEFGAARAEFQPLPKHRYHLELSLNLIESQDGFRIFCHYNRDLYNAETIEGWLAQYISLLEAGVVSEEANGTRAHVPESRPSIEQWNATTTAYPRDEGIDSLFERVAAERPDQVAISDQRHSLTYGSLNFQANLLADRLLAEKIMPGSLVGVCAERSAELIVACLAVLKIGCAYVPLDPSWPAERLRSMAREAGFAGVVTRLDHARHFTGKIVLLDGPKPLETRLCGDPEIPTNGDTPAYVIFTSGSTGTPKGVVVPHRAIARLVLNTNYVQLTPEDAVGHASNPAFDAATFEIWGPLLNGGRVVVLPKATMLKAAELRTALSANGVTTLFLTTALFNQLANTLPTTFKSLRHLLVGGDVANVGTFRRVLQEGAPERLLNIYGPTEVTTFACSYLVAEIPEEGRALPIGRPIANTTAYILDERQQPVPIGAAGELFLGGDGVALGYHRDPERTAERFLASPFREGERLYRTGDRARWRSDGQIEFLGRIDGQVKLRGFRVELGEIEAELSRHPAVRDSVVKVIGTEAEEKTLAAYFVPANGHSPDGEELRAFLQRRLPEYMVPRSFTALPAFPLTANGKADRQALPNPRPETRRANTPMTPLESEVAEIIGETLGVPEIGATDDFFQLGGHSLLAMDLMARLRKTFGVDVPPSVLFEGPNPRALAKFIREHQPKAAEETDFRFLVPIQRGVPGRKPLFLVPGGWGGEIEFLVYAQLGRLLESDQPIWGLKARGAGTGEPAHRTVTEMAADYLAEIKALQPRGPYWIGGECVGGICAHEMACQLREAGEQVAGLILLDTSVPNPDELADYLAQQEQERAAEVPRLSIGQRVRHHWEKLGKLSMGGKIVYLTKKLLRLPTAPPAVGGQHPRGQSEYPPTLMRHKLRPYPGRVTLLVDEEAYALHGQLGWEKAAIGELELHVLPGDHISYIRDEGLTAAQKLHEILTRTLQRS